ncbi:glycosyltransferase [Chryseobacterium hagamense]|uniref:Glycosyl transferase family 1 domain-containing protein n=1 Tax=Chryseobacterium hagamense TaxID=395935 RepID=A0A511YLT5_9FLAO|nr:glycosyltransferase [Chryseobacterium hagamense]GEN76163.1 hypothetical protein CHA01nite_19030 [Chryseobacterium hagamense]
MQIHATNIHGLGASQVVKSFLDASSSLGFLDNSNIYLPTTGLLSKYLPEKGHVIRYNRFLPNSISRLIECFFSNFLFYNEKTIVLGDIPLRGIKNQVVLVHQPNLVYPKINSNSSKSLGFRINRFLFSINNKFASTIIVQTGAMANDLMKSYPAIKDKLIISPQPVPNWLVENANKFKRNIGKDKIILFYPAAYYPHKKHEFIISLNSYIESNSIDFSNIEIWLTLEEEHFKQFESISFLKNLGKLSSDEMNLYYKKVDALLFMSSMESYGLPLVEAIFLELPIITVKYDYSQWICEDTAYYFEPYSPTSFVSALDKFICDYTVGSLPSYKDVVKKFPKSWDIIAETFFSH